MIDRIEISGLRGIENGVVDGLTPLTILVGPNGSGKSTILEALFLGIVDRPASEHWTVVNRRDGIDYGAGWLTRRPAENPTLLSVALTNTLTGDLALRETRLSLRAGGNLLVLRAEDGPPEIIAVKIVDPTRRTSELTLENTFSQVVRLGKRQAAVDAAQVILPDLQNLEILTEENHPIVYAVYEDRAVPVALSGDGVHALIRLSLELLIEKDGVVLLEESETHMHPAAIELAAKAIVAAVERGVQVVLTTHSLELIDRLLDRTRENGLIEKLTVFRVRLSHSGELSTVRIPGPDALFDRGQVGIDLR